MRRFSLFLIVVAIGCCGGCSKADAPPVVPNPAPPVQPVPVALPSLEAVEPKVESPQPTVPTEQVPAAKPTTEVPAASKVAADESKSLGEWKKLGLLFVEEKPTLQILAPPSSEYRTAPDGPLMYVYGPQFNLHIDFGSYDFKALADYLVEMNKVTIVDQQKDSLITKKDIVDPKNYTKRVDSYDVYLNRTVGIYDFRISTNTADKDSNWCVYSLGDVQRILRSGSQMELTRPLPTDPLALSQMLQIKLSHQLSGETVEQKEIVRADLLYASMTDSMLPVLAKFPSLMELRAGNSGTPYRGEYSVKGSSWKKVLSQLPQLKRLEFDGRDADDDAIAGISQLGSLTSLEMGHFTLRLESIKPLGKLTNLETLLINAELVTDAGFEQFPLLPKLKKLALAALQTKAEEFTGVGLRRLQMFPALRELELDAGDCGEAAFEQLGQIAALVELSVSSENLTDAGLAHLKELTNLEKLELRSEQVTDAGVAHLSGLTKLTSLNLSSASVANEGLSHLKTLVNLENLDLTNTQVTDAGLVHLSGLTKLEKLDLASSSVADEGLSHLKTLVNLNDLDLAETEVTDAGLIHLSPLKNLKNLRLTRTSITNAGIDSLLSLTQLESLSLWGTQIEGMDLEKLAALKSLKLLDVGGLKPPPDEGTIAKLKTALQKCAINTD